MSIYTIVSTGVSTGPGAPFIGNSSQKRLSQAAIHDALETGIIQSAIPVSSGNGMFVEINADTQPEADFLLDSLAYAERTDIDEGLQLAA